MKIGDFVAVKYEELENYDNNIIYGQIFSIDDGLVGLYVDDLKEYVLEEDLELIDNIVKEYVN